MKTLTFNLGAGVKDRAVRDMATALARAGAAVATTEVSAAPVRRAGVTFRSVHYTMADGQRVTLNVKETGDVFEVRINDKAVPISEQDDHRKAVVEIAERLGRGRAAYQRALARVRVPVPVAVRTSRVSRLAALQAKRDGLVDAIREAQKVLEGLRPATS